MKFSKVLHILRVFERKIEIRFPEIVTQHEKILYLRFYF